MSWFSFRPYVSVAQRRANAARELKKLSKKNGHTASPVILDGRKIAGTFWGKAWCDNLEAYSDFENRLPRGRSYVRNGSVVDLQISEGKVSARVSGSSLYKIEIKIKPLAATLWKTIQAECAGKIDSLIELLQGKLSSSVMEIVTRREQGLFPTPKEIDLDCSCPDWADLCKHVAASLYGVGARLDQNPELLFLLRGVDPSDLIGQVSAAQAVRQITGADGAPALTDKELTDVFGIELAETQASVQSDAKDSKLAAPQNQTPIAAVVKKAKAKPARKTSRRMSAAARTKLAAAARAKWEKAKEMADNPSAPRKLSAAATARIVAAQNPRWPAVKSAGRPVI